MQPFATAAAVLLPTLSFAAFARAQEPPPEPPPAPYVAHEWGTFTSMVGETGIVLEGLHREEEALPPFVHDLLRIEERGVTEEKLPASRVTQKMETPVIYFHCDEPLRVRVDVWFQQGLMTQFYPLPEAVWPRVAEARKQRIDMAKVAGSRLAWHVDLLPAGSSRPAAVPEVDAGHPWAIARQVRSAFVQTVAADGVRAEAEHYLFYRGLGRWQPEVRAVAQDDGVLLQNGLAAAIPFAAWLEVDDGGGRFALAEAGIEAGAERRFDLAAAPRVEGREALARQLGAAVLHALVQTGLHHDEARAMVATWSRSWFQSRGGRVIWIVPRAVTDQVLPLSLSPRPRELVRTLVGRLEVVTPAARRRVEDALRRGAHDELAALDRFLEPQLRNVVELGSDAIVRDLAAAALADLVGAADGSVRASRSLR